jgi:hypothetical protein
MDVLKVAERVLVKGWAADDEAKRLAHTVRRLHAGIEAHKDEQTSFGEGESMADRALWSLLETL